MKVVKQLGNWTLFYKEGVFQATYPDGTIIKFKNQMNARLYMITYKNNEEPLNLGGSFFEDHYFWR